MRTTLLIFTLLWLGVSLSQAQSITIIESAGWLESAYVKWTPASGTTSYNVYYTGGGFTNKKIDNQLIRSYGTYYRADVLGLTAGSYTITITPVISGNEGASTTTGNLSVLAHDRTGFAFESGRVPGAYKADGTPKDNALILYITENTKNTISLNITGANANPCVGLETIMEAYAKGKDTRPLIVRLIGNITDLSTMADGDILIEDNQNSSCYITAEGVGDDAVCNGWSFRVKNATNVEIRNLAAMNCNSTAGDDFGLQQDNDHIWVHNCDMFYGDAGSDADQIKGDGALDCKGSTYCTFSYNHFWDNGKSNLLGLSENTTTGLYVTYHHNWYDHSDSRHPRARFYSVHFYNNYCDGISKYGAGSTMGSSLFVEGNYYRNCKHPMMTSMQGTDVWNESTQKNDPNNMGTFSSEDGGSIKAYNNTLDPSNGTNNMRFVAYGDPDSKYNISGVISSTTDFDAYVAQTRDEQVPATVKSYQGSNVYNNFDTDASLYVKTLVIDAPAAALVKDTIYAGRVKGGDFKWKFSAADDISYAVNTALKTAITNYTSKLVFVQGENTSSGSSSQTLSSTSNYNQTVASGTIISTIVFTWGGDATDATVTGLPASGISYVKDATAQTITISGTPTATVSYSITTSGTTGTSVTSSGTITVTTTDSGTATNTADMIQNFTTSGKTSTFYTITGNLATNSSYGTATYAGLTLTQCLKMESSTSITFTTTASSTLILVFGSSYTGAVSIDGSSFTPSLGIVSTTLTVGAHTIKKVGINYLFYMSVAYSGNNTSTTPTITATTSASRCNAGTVTLGATSSAGTINWYTTATGGTSLGTGTSFTTPVIDVTTTYYAEATDNGSTSTTRTAITATINSTPNITATTPATRCGSGIVSLEANASSGTINWYSSVTGGTSLGTGTNFNTPNINTSTSYFVDATANACTTASRTEILATVNVIPSITSTTPATRCGSGIVGLEATASSGTINWYNSATGGTSVGTGTNFNTPNINTSTSYFVDATANACTTAGRTEIRATVTASPSINSTAPAARCDAGPVDLGATATSGNINWYASATGGYSLGTGNSFTTANLSSTKSYFVDATGNGCTTGVRTEIVATVNTSPSITATASAARCDAGSVNLEASTSAGIINWYATATGGTSLGTGSGFSTPNLNSTTSYFVDATANACTTSLRTEVVATINITPTITATAPAARLNTGQVTLSATASAGDINWYITATGGTSLFTGTSLTTPRISYTTSYYVDATENGCTTKTRTEIIATVNTQTDSTNSGVTEIPIIQNSDIKNISLCPNPVINKLTVSSEFRIQKIDIYNLAGTLVKCVDMKFNVVDITNLSPGCYLVKITTDQGIFSRTIIKK